MTQARAETFAISKNNITDFLRSVEGASRVIATFRPPDPDAGIATAQGLIAASLNTAREQLLVIEAILRTNYDSELP